MYNHGRDGSGAFVGQLDGASLEMGSRDFPEQSVGPREKQEL